MNEEINALAKDCGAYVWDKNTETPNGCYSAGDSMFTAKALKAFHDAAVEKGRSEAVPKGWRVVPTFATRAMIDAGDKYLVGLNRIPEPIYNAMLAAAPPAPLSASKETVTEENKK